MTDINTTAPELSSFYLTFGSNYDDGSHPTFPEACSKGYLTIMAETMASARATAFDRLGNQFAFIYDEQSFDPSPYSHGSLATI